MSLVDKFKLDIGFATDVCQLPIIDSNLYQKGTRLFKVATLQYCTHCKPRPLVYNKQQLNVSLHRLLPKLQGMV